MVKAALKKEGADAQPFANTPEKPEYSSHKQSLSLGLRFSPAGCASSVPIGGTKIPQAAQCNQ